MTTHWLNQIDNTTADFKKEFGHLTGDQLNWKPDVNTWSIAQNIDHLIVINSTYFPIIQQLRQRRHRTPFIAKIGWIVNALGKMILSSVQPDRRKKMKTFPMWEPAESNISHDIVMRFEKHQLALKQMIDECQDLLARKTVISSPANKYIVYRLDTAFDILVTHERRHFEQAKETLALLLSQK